VPVALFLPSARVFLPTADEARAKRRLDLPVWIATGLRGVE